MHYAAPKRRPKNIEALRFLAWFVNQYGDKRDPFGEHAGDPNHPKFLT